MFDLYLEHLALWNEGLKMTMSLTISAVFLGFFLAIPVGLARLKPTGIASRLAYGYVTLFRGVPLLVLLFLIYYGVGQFSRELRSLGVWWFFRDAYYCGLLGLVINTVAYQAEIIRGSLAAIPASVPETCAALNLNRWHSFRRVMLPIAFARALPALGNEFILLLKATSLLSIITVYDLMGQARFLFTETFDLSVYYVAAAHYLVIVLLFEALLRMLERRIRWSM